MKFGAVKYFYSQFRFLFLLICIGLLVSCKTGVQTRPVGYFRLGKITDLQAPENHIEKVGLLLRRDEQGYYVMSTYCTVDQSALEIEETDKGKVWYSRESGSRYSYDGKHISGPAIADLPYYELTFAASEYGGVKDSLFAQVGVEKPSTWRLPTSASPSVEP